MPKVKRAKAVTPEERIQALEQALDRQVREHRRLRGELDALKAKEPLVDLRAALRRQPKRYPSANPALDDAMDPDESA